MNKHETEGKRDGQEGEHPRHSCSTWDCQPNCRTVVFIVTGKNGHIKAKNWTLSLIQKDNHDTCSTSSSSFSNFIRTLIFYKSKSSLKNQQEQMWFFFAFLRVFHNVWRFFIICGNFKHEQRRWWRNRVIIRRSVDKNQEQVQSQRAAAKAMRQILKSLSCRKNSEMPSPSRSLLLSPHSKMFQSIPMGGLHMLSELKGKCILF